MSAAAGKRLMDAAGRHAAERGVPVNTVVKEILHYEIIDAMIDQGVAQQLVFQGGTCLRLCYAGDRYSEDLDFAGGADFDPSVMPAFENALRGRLASDYGLDIAITAKASSGDVVDLSKYAVKVHIPQADLSLPQKQVINIEIASVPSHDAVIASIAPNYQIIAPHLRTMALLAESEREILADKIVALAGRPYLKFRDVWDLKMLHSRRIELDMGLVRAKLGDYGLRADEFTEQLAERITELEDADIPQRFNAEMSRFVERRTMALFARPQMAIAYMRDGLSYAREALGELQGQEQGQSARKQPSSRAKTRMR